MRLAFLVTLCALGVLNLSSTYLSAAYFNATSASIVNMVAGLRQPGNFDRCQEVEESTCRSLGMIHRGLKGRLGWAAAIPLFSLLLAIEELVRRRRFPAEAQRKPEHGHAQSGDATSEHPRLP